jgi:hypothetical protein
MLNRKECQDHLNNPELILFHKVSKAIREALKSYSGNTSFYFSKYESKYQDKVATFLKSLGYDVYRDLTVFRLSGDLSLRIVWEEEGLDISKLDLEKL